MAVASQASADLFGVWSLGFSAYLAALTLVRAICSTPLLIAADNSGTPKQASAATMWVALLASVMTGIGSLALGSDQRGTLLVVALLLPALLLQDTLRHCHFARGNPRSAAMLDIGWLFLQGAGFTFLWLKGFQSPLTLTIAWGTGAIIVAASAWWVGARGCSLHDAITWFKRERATTPRLLADAGLASITTLALPLVLTITSGAATAGALRAGLTIFGPINIAVAGLAPVATVEASKRVRAGRSPGAVLVIWTLTLGSLGVAYGLGTLLIPRSWGVLLFGDSWSASTVLLPALMVQAAVGGPIYGVPILFRAARQLNRLVRLRVLTSIPLLVVPTAGAVMGGLKWAGWGLALSAVIGSCVALYDVWRGPEL